MKTKKVLGALLSISMIAGMLAGCGSQAAETTQPTEAEQPKTVAATTEGSETTEAVTPADIKIWHDGDEAIMNAIATQVNAQLADQGITVIFEKKIGLTDQLKLYGNDAQNGPDMYFYAHDSLGTFVEMGILSPLTDVLEAGVTDGLLPMTVEAGQYKGEQYFMPVYFETLLFMYNKGLWKGEVPSTTDELYDYMVANTTADQYAVVNQHSTAYNVAPFINGFGGYIIDKDGNPGLDNAKTLEAIEYNQKFAALQADGDYNTVTTLFNEGKAAAVVGGPWLISGIKEAGIDLGIKSLSDFALPDGSKLAPYSGVQGVGVMKYALENKKAAIDKVLTAMAGKEVGVALAKDSNCAPANVSAYDDADVAANEMIMAIRQTAKTAEPMPNIPQMSVMWGPAEELLAAVNKSGANLNDTAKKCQDEALTAITDMQ